MNLFVLDSDPIIAAQYHCDKHVVKQILETFQMLGSAVIRHGATSDRMPLTSKGTPLRGGYHHHPVTKWVGENISNYWWTCEFGMALCAEYTFRYGKIHACQKGIEHLAMMWSLLPKGSMTDFAIAISPEQTCRKYSFFDSLSPVSKYRLYYNCDKAHFCRWTNRKTPFWFLVDNKQFNAPAITSHEAINGV
jgi:hypothetical protein